MRGHVESAAFCSLSAAASQCPQLASEPTSSDASCLTVMLLHCSTTCFYMLWHHLADLQLDALLHNLQDGNGEIDYNEVRVLARGVGMGTEAVAGMGRGKRLRSHVCSGCTMQPTPCQSCCAC